MDKPPKVRDRGDIGLLDWLDTLLAFIVASRPLRSEYCELHETPDGSQVLPTALDTAAATSATANLQFTVVDASAKDAQGNAHPGRVRVYKGFLGGLRPAEMNLIDGVLPDGTDKRCYLTMPEGTGYVYGKLLIDTTLGTGTKADVYAVASTEEPDGTYLYLLIAQVTTTNGAPNIEQIWTGNWSPVPLSSGDGSVLSPAGQ